MYYYYNDITMLRYSDVSSENIEYKKIKHVLFYNFLFEYELELYLPFLPENNNFKNTIGYFLKINMFLVKL